MFKFSLQNTLKLGALYLLIFLIIITPYFNVGRFDIICVLFFSAYYFLKLKFKIPYKIYNHLLLLFCLVFISFYGSIISYFYSIPQFQHFYIMLAFFLVYISFLGIYLFMTNCGISFIHITNAIIFAAVVNSLIILFEFSFQPFRDFIENFLVQFPGSNYATGMRFRGLASAGGAGLSILNSLVFAIILEKICLSAKSGFLVLCAFIIFCATVFIGRTGLLIILLLSLYYSFRSYKIFIFSSVVGAFLMFSIVFLQDYFKQIFNDDFLWVSAGFLLEGIDWFENEGTMDALQTFYFWPSGINLFIGYGFYGIGNFTPWTDSGYMRSILSVGLPLSLIIYTIYLKFIFHGIYLDRFFSLLLVILLVAEYKEPLLFSGFSSRVFILLVAGKYFTKFHKF
jgi:hypothetical protein